jgi:thiosulfate/3-mercaptopyruvate sulfurtransferase
MKTTFSIIITLLLSLSAISQDLIPANEARKFVNNKSAVIVSTRSAEDYAKVHITGSVHIDVEDLASKTDPKGILKSPAELASLLGAKGIDPSKKVIIYDTGLGNNAGRLYWILKYLGFSDVKILDGHINGWRAARGPVTNAATSVTATTFTPNVNSKIFADINYVKSKINSAVLVDVRDDSEVAKGTIKGSVHFEYKKVVNEDGTLKSKAELEKLFNDAGIVKSKEIIIYCATSVRSGIVFLALTSVLDYPNVKVYEGAYNEWILN